MPERRSGARKVANDVLNIVGASASILVVARQNKVDMLQYDFGDSSGSELQGHSDVWLDEDYDDDD
jgi:hypothetical protein